jgi:peptidyl-tRNA hydrolase, PTH1 family
VPQGLYCDMNPIQIICGLGNPGEEYEQTRHNAGFWFVDALARECGVSLRKEAKFSGWVGKVPLNGHSAWLLKPNTFMNRSGKALAALANFYQIAPDAILVVHDELDLLPGSSKMKQGGSHAGHNGLKDIQALLGSQQFWRIRLGIGHPRTLALNQEVIDFVLHRPSREHRALIDAEIDRALTIVPSALAGELNVATMKLHTRPKLMAKDSAEAGSEPLPKPKNLSKPD